MLGAEMITETTGNLLAADADALVNTVNTEGVMGKGIALQFKKAYPAMYDAYRRAAKSGEVHLGSMHVWPTGQMTGPRYIINFPTKGHWKSRSRLKDIESGLLDLVKTIAELRITSIALPPLGCGNGGLKWTDVHPRIVEAFKELPDVHVLLFAPGPPPSAADMPTATARPSMTPGRAAPGEILNLYTRQTSMTPGLIESQKLMYFLQEAGEPLRLQYAANRYGPYADNLRHVLSLIEGHFLSGFGDGSAPVSEAEALAVLPGAPEMAERVLAQAQDTRMRIDRVLELASGFESSYGLELLATVHWLATREQPTSDEVLIHQLQDWSPRKARMFTPEHIRFALTTLRDRQWLPAVAPA